MAYYTEIHSNKLKEELGNTKSSSGLSTPPVKKGINERVGVDGIILKSTTAFEIQKEYGLAYDLFDVNGFTFEIKYFLKSFSCFFAQQDSSKSIIAVRMWDKFPAFKAFAKKNGMTQGELTLHDVFNREGREEVAQPSHDETSFVDYGFYRYHFFDDGGDPFNVPIESITIVAR